MKEGFGGREGKGFNYNTEKACLKNDILVETWGGEKLNHDISGGEEFQIEGTAGERP